MVTSASVVFAAGAAGTPADAAALPDAEGEGVGDAAGSAGPQPMGRIDAKPAPSASALKVRLAKTSWRRR